MMHRSTQRFALILTLLLATAAGPSSAAANDQLQKPRAVDRHVINVVSTLMQEHLSKRPLDDEISRRSLKKFLDRLDPMKMYFQAADIDEFMQRKDDLDDMIRDLDASFAYTIFNRFLQRVEERLALVDEFVDAEHDFTADEYFVIEPDEINHPATDEQARQQWRKRIKYDLLTYRADGELSAIESRDAIWRRYHSFAKRLKLTDADELLEMYLTSMTTSFDPHTAYLSPSALENFRIAMRLDLEGIGATLQLDDGFHLPGEPAGEREAHFVAKIMRVVPGGAAAEQGQLQDGDHIVSVGEGDEGEMVDVIDMKLGDIVKLIRGPAGKVVRLGVIPNEQKELQIYSITRARVELKEAEAQGKVFDVGKNEDGSPISIGVVDLPSFYMDMEGARNGLREFKSTTRDVQRILQDFGRENVDALVLDLRHNGGGSLSEAIKLTGLFIDRGPVVQVRGLDGRVERYDDLDRGMVWDRPLVVLTSKLSASASEIFAGAIQDYGRGLIVGDESTHGKGTVQSQLDLGAALFRLEKPPNLGALNLTIQQFYRPNGDSTQLRGVRADLVLPSLTDQLDGAEADLEYALDFDKVEAAPFSKYDMIGDAILRKLRDASKTRCSGSEDFHKLLADIGRYLKRKDETRVPLAEEKFKARWQERQTAQPEEEEPEEPASEEEAIDRDFYLDEVIAITRDYVDALAATESG